MGIQISSVIETAVGPIGCKHTETIGEYISIVPDPHLMCNRCTFTIAFWSTSTAAAASSISLLTSSRLRTSS